MSRRKILGLAWGAVSFFGLGAIRYLASGFLGTFGYYAPWIAALSALVIFEWEHISPPLATAWPRFRPLTARALKKRTIRLADEIHEFVRAHPNAHDAEREDRAAWVAERNADRAGDAEAVKRLRQEARERFDRRSEGTPFENEFADTFKGRLQALVREYEARGLLERFGDHHFITGPATNVGNMVGLADDLKALAERL